MTTVMAASALSAMSSTVSATWAAPIFFRIELYVYDEINELTCVRKTSRVKVGWREARETRRSHTVRSSQELYTAEGPQVRLG